jgi:hypothetical protein
MTFHGESRAPKEVMHHAHESPPVMLVPLYVLAAGALFAGLYFAKPFIGEGVAEFWKGSLVLDTHLLKEMHHTSFWIAALPTVAMLLGFFVAYWFYIARPETPLRLAREHELLYRFLLNKWYFDEVYDYLLVRPAMMLGRYRRLRTGRRLGAGHRRDPKCGPSADRISLSLRLRNALGRGPSCDVDDVRGMMRVVAYRCKRQPSPPVGEGSLSLCERAGEGCVTNVGKSPSSVVRKSRTTPSPTRGKGSGALP